MDRSRARMLSPPRRLGGNPARNSTGFLDSAGSAAYDSYYGYPRSSRESVPGPRGSTERVEPIRRRFVIPVRDPPPPARRQDDYDVPPRRVEPRGPPKVISPVQTSRPIVRTVEGRPRADEGYYLTPGTSRGHHRASSTSGRPTPDRAQYGRPPPPRERHDPVYDRGSRAYKNTPAIRQPRDQNDRDFGYEYTDFKEQARRDLLPVPRQRVRRESDVGQRPASTIGIDDVKRASRGNGPPMTTRGLEKMSRGGDAEYRGGPVRGPDSDYEPIVRRRSTRDSDRGSVAVHQDRDSAAEDGYRKHRRRRGDDEAKEKSSSRYDDRSVKGEERSKRHHERRASGDESRRRHRHHRGDSRDYRDSGRDDPEREYVRRRPRVNEAERDRRNDPEDDREYRPRAKQADPGEAERHKHHHFGSGAAALGAAATAAGIYAKQRHAHDGDGTAKRTSRDAGRPVERSSQETMEDSDSDEDPEERREQRHRRRKERDEREQSDRIRGSEAMPVESTRGNGAVIPQIRADDDPDYRGRRGSSESSESTESTEKREVRLVSPEREEAKKPKGILKSPKVRFPEDPAPVREGVAPLKEAGKKGIPPNARWTKIDRRLVNPAALDIGNERYEERDEYVIVLRVLSKDEIKAYAAKTAELRDERRREDERRGQMLALEDRAHQYEDEKGPQLQLDDHAYNEEITIPGITATAPPTQPYAMAPPPAQQQNAYANRSEVQATPEAYMQRPEAFSAQSYVRMPPSQGSSSMASSISNLSYPAPPPLQSSPQPSQQQQQSPPPLGPPGSASYPPPSAGGYPPPPAGSAVPLYYPPPQGSAGGQQGFPPPPGGASDHGRQTSVPSLQSATTSPPPVVKMSGDTSPPTGRSPPLDHDVSQRQA